MSNLSFDEILALAKKSVAENKRLDKSYGISVLFRADVYKKALSFTGALIGGKYVSEERQKKRLLICAECPSLGMHGDSLVCTECSCRLKGDYIMTSLAAYEETADYGCKYETGSKWKKAGV